MDHLRRADVRVAEGTNRWHNNKYKYRHPIEHQTRKARSKLNYINPFFYLGRIMRNIKSIFKGHY